MKYSNSVFLNFISLVCPPQVLRGPRASAEGRRGGGGKGAGEGREGRVRGEDK